jgi:SAM-dependent methyltransferase
MRDAIVELAPWHHDIEVAPGIWTRAVAEEALGSAATTATGTGQPAAHRPVEKTELLLRAIYPDGLEGRSVLDCACNAGGHLFGAARAGAGSGFGFDAREHWIAQARFLAQYLPAADLEFEVLDLYDLPSQNRGRFDVCFFSGIFYHLPDPVAGLRIAADHTVEVLILNTATRNGPGGVLVLNQESDEAVVSGVHRLAWLPTPDVLQPILEWCGMPHVRVIWETPQAEHAPRGWGRVALAAARNAGALENLERALRTAPQSSRAPDHQAQAPPLNPTRRGGTARGTAICRNG